MVIKWGICCAGLISHDFTGAFREFMDSSNEIIAVAARSEERAKRFAEKFKIKNYFNTYDKLAECKDVDIVYIGSLHIEHCKLTKLFLNNGKHVLVEKPMAISVAETQEMINLARKKKLFLMEGVWSLFFPLYNELRNSVTNGIIGSPRHLNANFQVNISKVDRVTQKELGGGGLHDIGIYVLQFALWIFQDRKLLNASCDLKRKNDVDIYGIIKLEFENEGTAFLNYHTGVHGDTSASIYGDTGNIIIPKNFWSPEEIITNGKFDQSFKLQRKDESIIYNYPNSWYFIYEIRHVAHCIEKGLLESDIHPLDASLKLAELMENFLKK